MLVHEDSANFKTTKPAWYLTTAKYRQTNLRKSLWQLLDTFVPYCVLWAAMIYTFQRGVPYWITLALAVVAGGILVRIFILFHDCCHGSFFASRWATWFWAMSQGSLLLRPLNTGGPPIVYIMPRREIWTVGESALSGR